MPDGDTPDGDEPRFDFTRDVSRRRLMRTGGGLAVFGIAAPAQGSFNAEDFDVARLQEMDEVEVEEQGLEYFTIRQARVVHDMTARIYPSDDNGPGAPEAGVVYFIDGQMNSAWGRGERWYMQGPFAGKDPTDPFEEDAEEPADIDESPRVPWAETNPSETQGWQYALTPNEAYDQGIHAVEEYVQAEYDADSFTGLEDEQQDEVIEALEEGEVETFEDSDIDPDGFFLLVRQNTLEGMFSDPMYGGNREMVGWRLKGFPGTPGALGSYREMIEEDEYVELEEGDYRKLADDVESLGIDGENDEPANAQSEEGHAHVHDAAEADYPNIVDEAAARGETDAIDEEEDGITRASLDGDADADGEGDGDLDDTLADEGGDR
ncbi:gluconate 2-dehydrogenase subunit 3 family protein [Halopiger aswanensis]|uniref:Gluconate 2-dehydrogenase subunit 3-like protein n=1 Tax=Halopiger aswanensis TaxID=148449 RepID=A0A3R7HIV2_9EURY|nr:gluconate 2-dehydrogenase subunit 3 family protein [Halopiger aswanensis]RKD95445.1 gluconate 2-dehydrogenase subunit 3-like protein [Halopiger aswanensis]